MFDSIAWALTRDRARLESIIAHDEDYFSFASDRGGSSTGEAEASE